MFEVNSSRRVLAAVVLCVALIAGPAQGQETPKKGGSVPITFVPPPVENATYSVGIYDVKIGKLARRLCEAAGQSTFKIGLNGLVTSWDGKDDDGKPLPPGKYAARGYAVGPLKVEGEAVLGNDWAANDDLRVRRVETIACVPEDDGLAAVLNVGPDRWVVARFKGSDGSLVWQKPVAAPFRMLRSPDVAMCALEAKDDGLIVSGSGDKRIEYRWSDGESRVLPSSSATSPRRIVALGKNESVWKIEDRVLSQYSPKGEMLRALGPKENEPTPNTVVASTKSERLYLLEESKDNWQRVRGLAWVDTKEENGKPVSTWQTFFERNIRPPDPATGLDDASATGTGGSVEVPLAENPLAPAKHETIKLVGTFDDKGSYLSTADGLRLRQISQLGSLRAVRLVQEKNGNGLTFFQTDGAAWDEFSIKGTREIISFDAGEFEIDAAGEKPVTEKAPEPDL